MVSKRSAILDAAVTLFAERGFDGVGLREIARAADVAQPTVNYHFESKVKLLEAVVAHGAERTTGLRKERLAQMIADTPDFALEDVVRIIFAPYNEPKESSEQELTFNRFIWKIGADASDFAKKMIMEAYDDMAAHFVDAMIQAEPEFTRESAAKAYLCALPSGMFSIDHVHRMAALAAASGERSSAQYNFDDIIVFVCAGMRSMKV